MLIKPYGPEPEAARRHRPAAGIGAETRIITGNPDQTPALAAGLEDHVRTVEIMVSLAG